MSVPDLESLGKTEDDDELSQFSNSSTNISEEDIVDQEAAVVDDDTQNEAHNKASSTRAWGSAGKEKADSSSRQLEEKEAKLLTRRNSLGPSKLGKTSLCFIKAP